MMDKEYLEPIQRLDSLDEQEEFAAAPADDTPPPHEPREETDIDEELAGEKPSLEDLKTLWRILRPYKRLALFIMICLGVALWWPYFYQAKVHNITKLEQRIKDLQVKSLYVRAKLIEYEQINNVSSRVAYYGLPLVPSTRPPFQLKPQAAPDKQ